MPAVKTRTVPALYKALCMLELLSSSRTGMTLPELVEQSNLAKSSAHYLLVTLERCGYVRRSDRNGRYMLGVKLFSMANSAIGSLNLRQQTAPYLSGLRIRTGLTVHMAILEKNEAILVARQETQRGARLASWVGKRMDMHCTAIGKAMLAFLPEPEIEAIIRKHGLARHNENTIASVRPLRDELERIVKAGYAMDNEEDELGVRCLGVPVFGPAGRPLAAISIAGSTQEVSLEDVPRFVKELHHVSAGISHTVAESMLAASVSNMQVSNAS
jgi:DNA-binding IclR family transcriptional regulator